MSGSTSYPGLQIPSTVPSAVHQPPTGYQVEPRPTNQGIPTPTETNVDTQPDAYYHFVFQSPSGDLYQGYLYDDATRYTQGQQIASPWGANYGYYLIDYKQDYGYDLSSRHGSGTTYYNEGAVYITGYRDYTSTVAYNDYIPYDYRNNWYSTTHGLGWEYDWVQKGNTFDSYGYGGYYLA
jgi:hypothetical protein